ncbi:MAG: HlyD family efflux transporter periplasmic adaptor subunit [Pseudomonadales bacterium]|nr:HlyD family efflux transporter periplasmic adaptor subunit [Pseudomonadales bacterium]MCP5329743.1 HlyD family efflux transporter periplasmic adaptor subunit [Pseudomonadales bacterium]MCP5343718.1 HlyD family efflux transporter periplasmic adaptor subunit [Pseudomonadales bacterium]
MSAQSLFRVQVLQHTGGDPLGSVLVSRTPFFALWTVLALVFIVAGLVFVLRVPLNQSVVARGHLAPSQGAVKVLSPSAGTVSGVYVREGQVVHEGQQLATIRQPVFDASGEAGVDEGLRQLQEELQRQRNREALVRQESALRRSSLESRWQAGEEELALLHAQHGLLTQRQALAEAELARQSVLYRQGDIAQARLDQTRDALLQIEQSAVSLQYEIARQESGRAALQHEIRQLPAQRERELLEVAGAIARVHEREQQLRRDSEFSLMAPADGIVNNLLLQRGAAVDARVPFLDILPGGAVLEARLYLPSRALGELAPGQTVLLALDAYPARQYGYFSARVESLANTAVDPREHLLPVDIREPVYLLRARPLNVESERITLRAGMQFTAHIVTGRQTLFARMVSPLRSIGGRLWG